MRDKREALFDVLAPWLADNYCARCDSFGHVDQTSPSGLDRPWCNVCWDNAKPLPHSLRRFIEEGRKA